MQEDQRTVLVQRLRSRLLAEARQDGWGYYAGKATRIEPTCWALLALGEAWAGPSSWSDFAGPRLAALTARQTGGGLLTDTEPSLANLTANALAALVCVRHRALLDSGAFLGRLYAGLIALKGVRLENNDAKQNNQLQAWPWVQDTFSWVEPTAWCLLALKRAPADVRTAQLSARVAEAEAMLDNRMCVDGGWNYGNASTLGQDLRAYVPTTAAGLLSLQDRPQSQTVSRSLQRLRADQLNEPGTTTLALTRLALGLHGVAVDALDERLMLAAATSEAAGHLQAVALAAYALSSPEHRMEALRVTA